MTCDLTTKSAFVPVVPLSPPMHHKAHYICLSIVSCLLPFTAMQRRLWRVHGSLGVGARPANRPRCSSLPAVCQAVAWGLYARLLPLRLGSHGRQQGVPSRIIQASHHAPTPRPTSTAASPL